MPLCFIALLLAIFPSHASADSGWLLTTGDFRQQPVTLDAIDAQAVRVTPLGGDASIAIPFDSFLQLDRAAGRPTGGPAKFTLVLVGGDRMTGQPVSLKDEQLTWRSAAIGELTVPLKSLRALLRSGQAVENPDEQATEDRILLANGDSVKGIVTDITDAKITIQANDAPVEIPLDAIRWVQFAVTTQPKPASASAFRIQLNDGSAFTAASLLADAQTITLTLSDGGKRPLPLSAVTGIEQLNGPVSWLSSRPPKAIVQTPYLSSRPWPTRMDSTVGGRPITFAGRTYTRGIGVHAYSRLDYALDGSCEAFRTQYAISQETARQYADVTVRIKLDGRTVHETVNFKADVLSPLVLIDLPKDAKLLTLEVDYGEANDTQDRFNWIEPALLRKKPAASATTRP